jgi:Zn-dependent protease with chaperone function
MQQRPEFAPSDFFSRQDAARARTSRLVLWFILALAGTVGAIYGAAVLCFGILGSKAHRHAELALWDPGLFFGCLGATLLIVGGASLFKSSQLSGGGDSVAESVGGRRVDSDTHDADERRLLNIVEEMSIASGVPVPDVYILDGEDGINAFAAGDSIENAAVAVSRGALMKLERDELQAVMGHEFSHILNGDMRLNVRLIGWIFGLLAITLIGRLLMQFTPSSRSRDKDSGNAGMALVLFGVLVMIIGYIGSFFAQLIQASISRQREHLADASATQFTRNPDALANALRRIAGDSAGTRLTNPHASEVAHMCFGEGVASAFATHPPLEERIKLLKPDWDGTALPPLDPERAKYFAPKNDETVDRNFRERFMHNSPAAAAFSSGERAAPPLLPSKSTIPSGISELVRDPLGAQAAALLLIMTDNPADNNAQAISLKGAVSPELFNKLKASWSFAHAVPARERLAVVQLAAPALRHLSRADADSLVSNLRTLAQSDGAVSFFEIALIRLVASVTHPADDKAEERSTAVLRPALRLIAGAIVRASGDDASPAQLAGAMNLAPAFGSITDLPADGELTLDAIEAAFTTLATADFPRRKQVMAVAERLVTHDGHINDAEADLLRALASALRCPTGAV